MGWLGAIAGGAEAANTVIDNRLKAMNEEETRQSLLKKEIDLAKMRDEIEAQKEQRVEEAEIAREGRKEQIDMRQEERTHDNAIRTRNENFEFNTDPNKAIAVSRAKVAGQQVEDQYKDSRFDTELDQKKQIAKATDKTDYEQRRLDHEKTQIEIANALSKSNDLTEREKKALEIYSKDYQNRYENVQKRLAEGNLDINSDEYVAANTDLYNRKQAIDALLGYETKPFKQGEDYAGIRTEEEKPKPEPEKKKTGLLDAVKEDFKSKPASSETREFQIRQKVLADIEKRKAGTPLERIWKELNKKPTSGGNQYNPQGRFESDEDLYNKILQEELSKR